MLGFDHQRMNCSQLSYRESSPCTISQFPVGPNLGFSFHGDARYRPTVVSHPPATGIFQEHERPAAGFDE